MRNLILDIRVKCQMEMLKSLLNIREPEVQRRHSLSLNKKNI